MGNPELADPLGPLGIAQHEAVEQLGARASRRSVTWAAFTAFLVALILL